MISIAVASYHGAPVPPLAALFDVGGGSIGRADTNRLVLPDPDRNISRVHAEIVHRNENAFAVVNRGSSAIALNGRAIESGGDGPLRAGDELRIGGYVLRVALASAAAPSAMPSPVAAATAIPADWDPFAMDDLVSSPPMDTARRADAVPPASAPARPSTADTSLDAFFGLQAGGGESLSGWGQESQPAAIPAANHAEQTIPPPHVAPAQGGARHLAGGHGTERAPPAGAVLSWNFPSGESTSTVLLGGGAAPAVVARSAQRMAAPPAPPPVARAQPAAVARPQPTGAPPFQQGTAPPQAKPASRPAAAPAPAAFEAGPPAQGDLAALANAWREGLAAEGLPPEALRLTPALMLLLGRLLREVTSGTLDLLAARGALKREIRAEVTMIVARDNNPLKFSSSVDIALGHLLGAAERGFKPADIAMREAYEDLRAHQFATLAGMRAALEGIFVRFDPAQLEGKLTQKSVVESLLPSARKARMWDLFNQMYTQLASEAQDDFHELFGKAFLRAYEEHLGHLEDERS